MINRWLHTPINARELEGLGDPGRADRIRAETRDYIDEAVALGNEVFGEFIHLFHPRRRRIALPSR